MLSNLTVYSARKGREAEAFHYFRAAATHGNEALKAVIAAVSGGGGARSKKSEAANSARVSARESRARAAPQQQVSFSGLYLSSHLSTIYLFLYHLYRLFHFTFIIFSPSRLAIFPLSRVSRKLNLYAPHPLV